jgi:hypothetical protein
MGFTRKELTPEMLRCMSPEDQKSYGPEPRPSFEADPHPPPVTDKLEREEQRHFANWCLLHNYGFIWHSTAHRSKASVGCPDFVVAVNRLMPGLWIEFKRAPNKLSEDQRKFKEILEAQGVTYWIVYSAGEAIALVEQFANKHA